MASGVECAGLLIGVLPLFIEVGKAYADGVDKLLNVVISSRREEALEDFYDDFHEQIVEINEQVKTIYSSISKTISGGNLPTPTEFLTKWREDSTIEQALRAYLGGEDRFNRFTRISSKIVQLLGSLIKDKTTSLSEKHQDEAHMFQKLKGFALRQDSDTLKTSFGERFRFFKGKKHREKFLNKLQACTGSLEKLISRVEHQSFQARADDGKYVGLAGTQAKLRNPPSLQVRALIASLYNAMKKHWNCGCKSEHEVKFRLTQDVCDETPVVLEFLIFSDAHATGSCWWQEARVSVTSHSGGGGNFDVRTQLNKICDLLQPSHTRVSLHFLVEDIDGQQNMSQLPPKPRRLRFHESQDPTSLQDLLNGAGKMSRREKLSLALTVSYSLLLYHDSAWISRGWDKRDICFFYKQEDEPDYESPYLSSRFTTPHVDQGQKSGVLRSPNENILALGILLLEIFEEKPIERWRNRKDKENLYEFTDWDVAERVVEKMDPSSSRLAVKACLQWLKEATCEINLENREIRTELVRRVIIPLEQDLESLELI